MRPVFVNIHQRYSELVPKPSNEEAWGRKGIWRKNTLGCMAGFTLAFICVAAAKAFVRLRGDQQLTKGLKPASGHKVTGERRPAINQGPQACQWS